jgi:branched-subunit amino acid aminotransferase/4-amino-4-deoxychorismate lyase
MSMDSVYLNGAFMAADKARISPQDRGFRFGDGVFETIPFFAETPYQWGFHMERLADGLASLQIKCNADWRAIADELIAQNNASEGFIRIAISRGVGSRGYRPLPDIQPTVFVETLPRHSEQSEAVEESIAPDPSSLRSLGMTLCLSDWRKPAPNALPAHKLSHGINSTLALLAADAQGADEALLLSHDDALCEAASGNVFWIKDDALFTPALKTGCLNGATRHAVMRLYGAQEVIAALDTLQRADAVFVTNCNWGIWPVTALQPMGWQWRATHPLILQLQHAYRDDIHASV